MARTVEKLNAIDPGFQIDHVAVATVSLTGTPYAAAEARDPIFGRLQERLAAMPGVQAVGAINHLPLAGDEWRLSYTIDGRPVPAAGRPLGAVYRVVRPGYFSAMHIPVLHGRVIQQDDSAAAAPVAVINAAMAARRWPGVNPVGQRIHLPGPEGLTAPITIVGVVANARQSDWTAPPEDEVYVAYAQRAPEFGLTSLTFVLRTTGNPGPIAAAIPAAVATEAPSVAVSGSTTMTRIVADELWRQRITSDLSGLFAAVALVLAAIGIYSVVSYAVARRVREFGVRLALGATRREIQRVAVREGIGPALVGAAVGLALAAALGRLLASMLFDVSPFDPLAVSGAAAVLLAVAAFSAWLPARRASRVSPTVALRAE
jgi:putative ABC transport system permease protein